MDVEARVVEEGGGEDRSIGGGDDEGGLDVASGCEEVGYVEEREDVAVCH